MSNTDTLRTAAQAVLDRWDSPQWAWTKHGPTADLMANLRAALDADLNVQVKSAITQVQAVHAAFNAGALQQPAASGEPDMRHPKIQALIGGKARREIELRLVEQLLDDPDCDLSAMDMEYWNGLHDKLREKLLAATAQPAPAPAAQPDGTLHADGYFTWAEGKRPAYLLDKGLPAKFWTAAPNAQPAPARVPLTEAQIEKLREETFSTGNPFCPCDSKTMRKAVRAAESAHGIAPDAPADQSHPHRWHMNMTDKTATPPQADQA